MPRYVPVSPGRHGTKSWRRPENFTFAGSLTAVPIYIAEAVAAAGDMPLGVLLENGAYTLCSLVSLQTDRNAYVDPQTGRWLVPHVPAILKAHPFLFLKPSEQAEAVLCIDEEVGLLDGPSAGEALFDAGGRPSPSLEAAARNALEIEQSRVQTVAAMSALAEAGLLVPWQLRVSVGGVQRELPGLYHVDRARLEGLGAGSFRLHEVRALGVAYAQLVSESRVRDLQALAARLESLPAAVQPTRMSGPQSLESIFGTSSDGNLRFGS